MMWAFSSSYSSYPLSPLSRLVEDTGADLLTGSVSDMVDCVGLQSNDSPRSEEGMVARRLLGRTPLVSSPVQSLLLSTTSITGTLDLSSATTPLCLVILSCPVPALVHNINHWNIRPELCHHPTLLGNLVSSFSPQVSSMVETSITHITSIPVRLPCQVDTLYLTLPTPHHCTILG